MVAFRYLVCVWTLVITHAPQAGSEVVFLKRQEGETVLLPCALKPSGLSPFGVYLKRTWLQPSNVLFKHTGSEFSVASDDDKSRTSVSGDPSTHQLNVTISQLRVRDTDRYSCEFVVENTASVDQHLPGTTDFFLLVTAGDAGAPVEVDLVQTCVGGSAQVPCALPNDWRGAVEGVILKRRRGDAAAEVLYDSKRHQGSSSSSSSQFSSERIRLSSAPGPDGITYNLSLQQLQLHDSGLYSCQLLQRDGPGGSAGLGRSAIFVSVQGGECSCSSSPALLYALSSAVVLLLLLLLCLVFVVCQTKSRRSVKACSQPPVYEEMARLHDAPSGPAPRPLGQKYNLYPVRTSSPVNHYETPSRAPSRALSKAAPE